MHRRAFLKTTLVTTASSLALAHDFEKSYLKILLPQNSNDAPILWLAGGVCGGCSMSMLNGTNPLSENMLFNVLQLHYQLYLSASSGEMALENLFLAQKRYQKKFILVIEGTLSTAYDGLTTLAGYYQGRYWSMKELVLTLCADAKYIMALGSCAAFGGVVASEPNPSGAVALEQLIKGKTSASIINIPGCAPHPDDAFGTLLQLLNKGLPALDAKKRPKEYFPNIHKMCRYYDDFKKENFASNLGEEGCKLPLGCMGPFTACNTEARGWNAITPKSAGVNGCLQSGSMCIGCTEEDFKKVAKFFYQASDLAEDEEDF